MCWWTCSIGKVVGSGGMNVEDAAGSGVAGRLRSTSSDGDRLSGGVIRLVFVDNDSIDYGRVARHKRTESKKVNIGSTFF